MADSEVPTPTPKKAGVQASSAKAEPLMRAGSSASVADSEDAPEKSFPGGVSKSLSPTDPQTLSPPNAVVQRNPLQRQRMLWGCACGYCERMCK